ncbi:hypothetical protein BD769DRAFT_1635457 [Suillus cothurnatus]|nr:hypothetical protein BD769DRAFT_1635457 [Suillus cothurnatus]
MNTPFTADRQCQGARVETSCETARLPSQFSLAQAGATIGASTKIITLRLPLPVVPKYLIKSDMTAKNADNEDSLQQIKNSNGGTHGFRNKQPQNIKLKGREGKVGEGLKEKIMLESPVAGPQIDRQPHRAGFEVVEVSSPFLLLKSSRQNKNEEDGGREVHSSSEKVQRNEKKPDEDEIVSHSISAVRNPRYVSTFPRQVL